MHDETQHYNEAAMASPSLPLRHQLTSALSSLSVDVQSCFSSNPSSTEIMNQVASTLQAFGPSGVRTAIKEMLQDEALLAGVARVSYLHKNGFYKLLLVDEHDYKIRLHIWMPGVVAYETLHNHRWYMASTILAGTLHSEIWEESSSPTTPCYDDYLYVGKHDKPLLLGKTHVECVKSIVRAMGEAYTSRPHVLHRILFDGSAMAATLMCRSATTRKWSRNIIVNAVVPDAKPLYLTPNELEHVLIQYLKLENLKND